MARKLARISSDYRRGIAWQDASPSHGAAARLPGKPLTHLHSDASAGAFVIEDDQPQHQTVRRWRPFRCSPAWYVVKFACGRAVTHRQCFTSSVLLLPSALSFREICNSAQPPFVGKPQAALRQQLHCGIRCAAADRPGTTADPEAAQVLIRDRWFTQAFNRYETPSPHTEMSGVLTK